MRRMSAVIAVILVGLLTADLRTQQLPPLRVHFIDVGQGDSVLIQSPGGINVLYDGGENPTRVRDYLRGIGITDLPLVIASHNHADHIGGLSEVVRYFRPLFYMDNGVPATTQTYRRLLDTVAEAGSALVEPTLRQVSLDSGASILIVPPPGIPAWDQNDNSIGVVVEYGTFRLSLTGDAEQRQWSWWITNYRDWFPEVQIHKSSHHGSASGDTREALTRLSPEVVPISVGAGNSYGHPDARTLSLYTDLRSTVHRTDRNGTIVIEAQATGSYSVRLERAGTAQPTPVASARLLLFGGRNQRVFLGCYDCNRFDADSIHNQFGEYGSRFSSTSIWNRFSDYGSRFSDDSACNRFESNPPVIVDSAGRFYGALTVNRFASNAITTASVVAWLNDDVCAQ